MIEVVAALIQRDGRVLICRRPPQKARAGRWDFPGGKVEAGETPEQALCRECREELAVCLDVQGLVAQTVYAYDDVTIHLSLFSALVREGVLTPLEHSEIRFVSPEDFSAYAFCPADQAFLPKIISLSAGV